MTPAPDDRQHLATRLLLPNLAAMIALFALFWGLFAGDGAQKLFRDSDTGWHIRTGESILAGNPLPDRDPYSLTKAGQRWFAWEWGADVLMGAAHRNDGLRAVALLFALSAAWAVWIWVRLHWIVGGNFFVVCLMAVPFLTTVSLHWLARPHVFSWILSIAALLLMERASRASENIFRIFPDGIGLFAFGCLWANVHASFLFLPCLALVYAVGSAARVWILGDSDRPNPGWFLAAAGCAAAGSLLNPYGIALHGHVLRYLSDRELLARIGEYQSFNFHAEGAWQILLTVGIALMGAPLTLWRRRPEHFLLICAISAMALRSARALPLLALLALPLINGALTELLKQVRIRAGLRASLDLFLAYSDRLRLLDARCGGYTVALLSVALAWILLHAPAIAAQTGFPPSEFPIAAANKAVASLPSAVRILAPDKFGGYLIYRFNGERKVFFDGRSDFYGVEFLKRYIRLIEARPGWRKEVDAFGFTHALLPVNYSLVDGLRHWGWREIYRDNTAVLLQR